MAKGVKKVTRKEDAASIVGEELALELDAKSKVIKSDVLVEFSETEPTAEETQELVGEIEAAEVAEAPAEPATEPVAESAESVEPAEVAKSDAPIEEKMDASQLPYGGAVSLKEALAVQEAKEEMWHIMDMWSLLSQVAWNIIDRDDITDKKAAFAKAVDEFKSAIAAKAMVEFSQASTSATPATPATQPAESSVEKASVEAHPLKPALDALLSAVDNSLVLEGTTDAKLQYIQPTLQELGEAITGFVKESVAQEPPAPNDNKDNLLDDIKQLIQPLTLSLQQLSDRVGVMESKSNAANVPQKTRIPQPRSLPGSVVQRSEQAKPGSLRSIINKSVGLE